MKQPPQIKDHQIQIGINMLQVMEDGSFRRFVDMLYDWLKQHRIYGDTAEGIDMIRNQGAILILKHLIEEIEGNRERYNKMQGNR